MLSPLPPRDASRDERERYDRDQEAKRKLPEAWGYLRNPDVVAARHIAISGAIAAILARDETVSKPSVGDINALVALPTPVTLRERDQVWEHMAPVISAMTASKPRRGRAGAR